MGVLQTVKLNFIHGTYGPLSQKIIVKYLIHFWFQIFYRTVQLYIFAITILAVIFAFQNVILIALLATLSNGVIIQFLIQNQRVAFLDFSKIQ